MVFLITTLFSILWFSTSQAQETVHSTILRVELTQVIAGLPIESQMRRLPQWLKERHGIRVRCDQGVLNGLSDLRCVYAMRQLANVLNLGGIARAPEVLTLEIGTEWKPLDTDARNARITFPYHAAEWAIAFYVNTETSKPAYLQRVRHLHQLEDLREEVERLSGKEIEIDSALNNVDATAGLMSLKFYLSTYPGPIKGPTEVIVISNAFRLPYERELRLKEDIPYLASIDRLKKYFAEKFRIGYANSWPQTFFKERELLQVEFEKFRTTFQIEDVVCSPKGVSMGECRQSLERLYPVLNSPLVKLPGIHQLVITASDDMPVAADSFFDAKSKKSILLVRSDFEIIPLMRVLNLLGWETSPGGHQ